MSMTVCYQECCDPTHVGKGGAAPQFGAKTRQELPPLFRQREVPKELRPENLNNQLQTSQLQTALKGTLFIAIESVRS